MEDLSLHILDISQNSIRAGASVINIYLTEDCERERLVLKITDNGEGMSREMLNRVTDPFTTTKEKQRIGLGLPLLEQAAVEAEGSFNISSIEGSGTEITAEFFLGSVNCKPVGDIASTIIAIILGNRDITVIYESNIGGKEIRIDTSTLVSSTGKTDTYDPSVIRTIRELLKP